MSDNASYPRRVLESAAGLLEERLSTLPSEELKRDSAEKIKFCREAVNLLKLYETFPPFEPGQMLIVEARETPLG